MNITDKKNILLHLSLIPNCGERTISFLTKKYNNIDDFYQYSKNDYIAIGISDRMSSIIYAGLKNKTLLHKEIHLIDKYNIHFTTPIESSYPKNLLYLETTPPIIYTKSNLQTEWSKLILLGIVSSRKTNRYGEKVIEELLNNLNGYPIGIVSGGAIGGDSYAHSYAIKNKLPTIAVMGCGLQHQYPIQNSKLFSEIIDQGGALLSHFPMEQKADKYTFPIRNAIIAGLSEAILVIQAGVKSGTLITAELALDFGRTIAAVPGSIFDPLSYGSNQLISKGGEVIHSVDDIFHLLNIKKNNIQNILNTKKDHSKKNENNAEINNTDILETDILSFCMSPKTIYEIATFCQKSHSSTQEIVYDLLLKNMITQDSLGKWLKK